MITSACNYTISELFGVDSDLVYNVPKYQREYTWSKEQWEKLFDDIEGSDNGYFLGSIICINQANDSLVTNQLEVVDGQQRLTSISILFAAIYQIFSELDLDDEQKNEMTNLKWKLRLKKNKNLQKFTPQAINDNLDDYLFILSEIGVISTRKKPQYARNRRIYKAFRYFSERVRDKISENTNNTESLIQFLEKLSKAILVKIEVSNHADAYTLFESLNNRGIPLTAVDIIKNKVLAKLETIEPSENDLHYETWNRIISDLGDDYSTQERFFRHYYNAFKSKYSNIYGISEARRSNLINIYEKLVDTDATFFLNDIADAAHHYSRILNPETNESLELLKKPFKDLGRIQGTPSYLLILYLLVNKEGLRLDEDCLSNIIELLVRFFVRRNLTDNPSTRDLTRIFMNLIDVIKDYREEEIYKQIENHLVKVSAPDDIFKDKLNGLIYEDNKGVARYILCAIAELDMTRENRVDLWEYQGKQYVWTIEHIFPQGSRIPKAWIDMVADGDVVKAKEVQQTHVHKLGNLTISGYNASLGNKSFNDKKNRTDSNGKAIGYNNGLKLNHDLVGVEKWDQNEIDKRSEKLVSKAMRMFLLRK